MGALDEYGATSFSLSDGAVLLRAFAPTDVDAVWKGRQDRETDRWLAGSPWPFERKDAERLVARWRGEEVGHPSRGLAIVDALTSEFLGAIMVVTHGDSEPPEVGYWLKHDARGRGIAARSLKLVCAWLLDEVGVPVIELVTHPDNVASQKTALRVGFVRRGVKPGYAMWRDGCTEGARFELGASR